MTVYRKPSEGGSSKATEQLAGDLAIEFATLFLLLLLKGGACLMIYSNAEVRHSTQRVLQYIESLKDMDDDRKGDRSSLVALII
jgi:hypothetical protein